MSWIKDNPFVAALGGATIIGAGALVFVGVHFTSKYNAALNAFQADSAEVLEAESLKPFPTPENLNGKAKALKEYKEDVVKIQEAFTPYRLGELAPITPQELTGNIKESSDQIRAAFDAVEGKVPETFFVGFEAYRSALAREGATSILNVELKAFTELFLSLAKAGSRELINVHRPELIEESGGKFEAKDASYRTLPLELTFRGSETSLRSFMSALATSPNHYYVVRTIRILNDKTVGPVPGDAQFETTQTEGAEASTNPFAGFAVVAEDGGIVGEDGSATGAAEPATPPVDTSRILQQVVGNEELTVFLRVDVVSFLPAKDLSKL